MSKILAGLLLASIMIGITVSLSAPTLAQGMLYGRPARLHDLTDLSPERNRMNLSVGEWTEVLLSWLVEERRQPSPTTGGVGGGEINSEYIQAQIVKALASQGDPLSMSMAVNSNQITDPTLRGVMHLVLGCMGDASETPVLLHVLQTDPSPYMREIAAGNLGIIGATQAIPILEGANHDPFFVPTINGITGKPDRFYPVREAAEGSLRVLSSPELVAQSQARRKTFSLRLAQERSNAVNQRQNVARLISVANRERLHKTSKPT